MTSSFHFFGLFLVADICVVYLNNQANPQIRALDDYTVQVESR